MRSFLFTVLTGVALTRCAALLAFGARERADQDDEEGRMWREFGLRKALANMPPTSPGRAVVEALLARGSLTPEEERRFKAEGLRAALASMPADSPGRAVVESLLARHSRAEAPRRAAGAAESASSAPAANAPGASLVDELERLVALRDRGHLTDQDYEAAKRKLLG